MGGYSDIHTIENTLNLCLESPVMEPSTLLKDLPLIMRSLTVLYIFAALNFPPD